MVDENTDVFILRDHPVLLELQSNERKKSGWTQVMRTVVDRLHNEFMDGVGFKEYLEKILAEIPYDPATFEMLRLLKAVVGQTPISIISDSNSFFIGHILKVRLYIFFYDVIIINILFPKSARHIN